jgi:hypothetical protein
MTDQNRDMLFGVFSDHPWLAEFLKEQTMSEERVARLRDLSIDWILIVKRLGENKA